MNEFILIIILFITMFTTYLLYKIYEKRGLFFAIVFQNIISFILSFKIVTILKLNINLGIVSILSVLTIMYLFMIKYGKKEINELIKISLYTNVLIAIFLTMINYFIPTLTETISINIKDTFISNYKILIAYPIVMLISQIIVTKLYLFVNKLQSSKIICIALTHIITALLYTIIFYVVGYIKVLSIKEAVYIGISTYIIGLIIMGINIVFINVLIKDKKVTK